MTLNLAQALGVLVQSAQSHLDGELLTNDDDMLLLKEAIQCLVETEKQLENEKKSESESESEKQQI